MNSIKDKSKQGFIDPDIITLLDILNKKYTTTSSCSGRITMMNGIKKGKAKWVYKTHTQANAQKIFEIIQQNESLRFFFEPFIIHLKCHSQDDGQELLKILHTNGFKRSGLISFKSLTVEIANTSGMETIVTKELSKEYIQILVTEANKRLQKTKDNIKRLEFLFS